MRINEETTARDLRTGFWICTACAVITLGGLIAAVLMVRAFL